MNTFAEYLRMITLLIPVTYGEQRRAHGKRRSEQKKMAYLRICFKRTGRILLGFSYGKHLKYKWINYSFRK